MWVRLKRITISETNMSGLTGQTQGANHKTKGVNSSCQLINGSNLKIFRNNDFSFGIIGINKNECNFYFLQWYGEYD
jgi:hypothetical protein